MEEGVFESNLKILYTKKYNMFGYIDENREIYPSRVQNLVSSIKQRDLLFASPMLVTKDYKIIDGQHRLEAAKILDLYIHYIISDFKDSDIISLNINSNNWSIKDYVHCYSKKGNSNYTSLIKFSESNNISLSLAYVFLGGKRRLFKDCMQNAQYIFPNEEVVNRSCIKLNLYKDLLVKIFQKVSKEDRHIYNIASSYSFMEAIGSLPCFVDLKRFFKDLEHHIYGIKREGGYKSYLKQFDMRGLINGNG